jgi:hypothetical protein
MVDISNPVVLVVVNPVKILVLDHHGTVDVDIIIYMNIRDMNIPHNNGSGSPVAPAIVRLVRSKGHPPHVDTEMDPGDPSGIPTEPHAQAWVTDMDADRNHRRSPVPITPDVNPVAVMVRHITERLSGYPHLVSIPDRPSTHGKGSPPNTHVDGSPKMPVLPIVIDPLPDPIIFQNIRLIIEHGRKVFY